MPPVQVKLPEFIIIGAAKSGTTFLSYLLNSHPQLFLSKIKEPEFFSDDCQFQKGLDWYSSLFEKAEPGQKCFEASTAYTRSPQYPLAAERLFYYLPSIKLIYLLRNPIERAYSHYVHRMTRELYRDQAIQYSFEEHVKHDPMCVDSSDYQFQIEQYLKFFPREQLLVVLSEDLRIQPNKVIQNICEFVGVTHVNLNVADVKKSNKTEDILEILHRKQIMKFSDKIKTIKRLKIILPEEIKLIFYRFLALTPYGKAIRKNFNPPPLSEKERKKLIDSFRESNEWISHFIQRDLSHWNQ